MRTMLRGKVTLLFLAFAVVMLAIPAIALAQDAGDSAGGISSAAPTIQSDKDDYAPGELVTLTGSGWQPGEEVTIVVEDTLDISWSQTDKVTADDAGNITDQVQLPTSFVSDYRVTATGPTSGTTTTDFTDSLSAQGATVNGASASGSGAVFPVIVGPGDPVPGGVTTTVGTSSEPNAWQATNWTIGSSSACRNDGANDDHFSSGTYTERFDMTAPSTSGTYDAALRPFDSPTCASGAGGSTATVANGVKVDSSVLFSEYFGSVATDDVPHWTDVNTDASDCAVSGPLNENYFAALEDSCTISTTNSNSRPIDTSGWRNVHVRFTWGKNSIPSGSTNSLNLYWKKESASTWNGPVCQVGQSTCSGGTVSGLASGTSSPTANSADVMLPSGAEGQSIDIRFEGKTSSTGNLRLDAVRVTGESRATQTALSRTAGTSPSTYGDSLTFTATVAATGGNPNGVGDVTFKDAGNTINGCSAVQLTGNTASCTVSKLSAGTHNNITAVYGGTTSGAPTFDPSTSDPVSQTVGQKALTVSGLSASNKTYDGTTTASITGTGTLVGVLAGDTVNLSGTPSGAFANADAGNTKTITVSGLSLSGNSAANYGLTQPTLSANILKRSVTASITAANKTYDGTTDADITSCTLNAFNGNVGKVAGDDVGCLATNARFDSATAGNGKTVTADASLGGDASGNYQLSSSTASTTANVEQAGQTITFNQPQSPQSYGATFNVNPTSDSGLAVTVQASGGCSVQAAQGGGYDVTMTSGTNNCLLTASQGGNANYNAADNVARTVAAQKVSQTITFNALSNKTYGDAPLTLSANGGASGNPVTFALGTGSKGCSLSGTNNATVTITGATGAGEKCIIDASQLGDANYAGAPSVTRDFTIAKAPLSVTAENKNMTYADPVPQLAYKITGFVYGETDATSGVTGQAGLATTATSSSPANTYPITVGIGTLAASNYSFPNLVNGTLTVAKRQANVVYTGDNYAAIQAAGNATINLSAKVSRLSGNLGNLSLANVEFTVKKFNGTVQGTPVLASVDANGNASATAQVPTSDDPYTVEVRITPANSYWTSGTDVSSLQVIVGSGTGRTAGGGWIADAANDINGKSNFGFTVQNSKTGIRGNSLFIYRVKEGANEVQYVVKSNSWVGGGLTFNVNTDPARATFTGKATVQRYVNGVLDTSFSSGNHTFTVDVLDGALKSPQVPDGYAITLRNSSNTVVKQLGSRTTPLTLGGGNVLVQAK